VSSKAEWFVLDDKLPRFPQFKPLH